MDNEQDTEGWGDACALLTFVDALPRLVDRGHVQNESDELLLLKIFVCVTVTSAGPTQAATLLDPVL